MSHPTVGLVFLLLSASSRNVALLTMDIFLAKIVLMLWEGGREWA